MRLLLARRGSSASPRAPSSPNQASADGRAIIAIEGMSVVLCEGTSGQPFLRLRHSVPMAAGWINLTPDACYLTYSALGHIQQVWDLSQLSEEMQKLGLPWRGPVMPAATPAGSVSGLKVHNDAE